MRPPAHIGGRTERPRQGGQRRGRGASAVGTAALVGIAAAGWTGAWLARPLSLLWPAALGVVVVAAWRARRRAVATCGCALVVGLVASALGADAWAGLSAAIPSRIEDRVELVGDPRPTRHGVRVEVRSDGRLWDLMAHGEAAGVLGALRSGETVVVSASTRPREPDDLWRASRHVVGTAAVERAGDAEPAWGPWRLANAVHRALLGSTSHLDADRRGVALGVSLGDRGAIGELLAEDLRAAGLSHLTAVSGQHVALLIAMAAPALGRLQPRPGALATLALLAGFVVLTRGEPSVLRAAAMALVAVGVRAGGRRAVALRVLAAVVTALVLIDPLLVWSVGFQLSVAATAGIAAGATRIAASLPGPRAVAGALGVSIAAQLAVAPLVIAHFGVMPLVGVAANLAVVPVIGPLMGWTLVAGVVAGLLPAVATVVHLPTDVLALWVVGVAEWSAAAGVPGIRGLPGAPVLAGLLVAGVCALGAGRMLGRRAIAMAGVSAVAIAAVVAAVGGSPGPASGRHPLGPGAEAVVGGGRVALVVDGRASPGAVLGGLRALGVGGVDLVVARSPAASAEAIVEAVTSRMGAAAVVVAPPGSALEGARAPVTRWEFPLGDQVLVAAPRPDGRLDVVVEGPV